MPGHYLNQCWFIVNILRPRQNGRHFPDDIFSWKENVSISFKISLKVVPKGRINNITALVRIMAWRRPGDKSLSEPMMVNLLTHICVTRPQWVNNYRTRKWVWKCLQNDGHSVSPYNVFSIRNSNASQWRHKLSFRPGFGLIKWLCHPVITYR